MGDIGMENAIDTDLNCTCYRVRKAARALTQFYDDALADAGATLTQMSVLTELSRTPNVSVTALGKRLGMDRTTLSRTIKPMLRDGWIKSGKSEDRRARNLEVTDTGIETLTHCNDGWRQAESRMLRTIGRENRTALFDLLDQVGGAVRETEPAKVA
ncbi:MAG: winged helix-turn-helix transcriptional regulator [Rhizobiales bacterium]|nr:winged helix-turn-helix transcriptional regulator [Hyphomicrobiales bacterium]